MRMAMWRSRSQSSRWGTISGACGEAGLEMIPTVLMVGMEKELLVAFGAEYRTFHDAGLESELSHSLTHPVTDGLVELRFADDTALADLALAHLELRFDQYNHLPIGAEKGDG